MSRQEQVPDITGKWDSAQRYHEEHNATGTDMSNSIKNQLYGHLTTKEYADVTNTRLPYTIPSLFTFYDKLQEVNFTRSFSSWH